VGANVECKPINLVQFAVLGAIFDRTSHGVARPRVGVLSNGTEEGKGTELTRAAHRALAAHPSADFSYIGYVEGKDIFKDERRRRRHRRLHRQRGPQGARGDRGLLREQLRAAIDERALSKVGALLMRPTFAPSRSASTPTTTAARRCSGSTA
jgi:glycerol-3-phosphate acyltransferase PlsX